MTLTLTMITLQDGINSIELTLGAKEVNPSLEENDVRDNPQDKSERAFLKSIQPSGTPNWCPPPKFNTAPRPAPALKHCTFTVCVVITVVLAVAGTIVIFSPRRAGMHV